MAINIWVDHWCMSKQMQSVSLTPPPMISKLYYIMLTFDVRFIKMGFMALNIQNINSVADSGGRRRSMTSLDAWMTWRNMVSGILMSWNLGPKCEPYYIKHILSGVSKFDLPDIIPLLFTICFRLEHFRGIRSDVPTIMLLQQTSPTPHSQK